MYSINFSKIFRLIFFLYSVLFLTLNIKASDEGKKNCLIQNFNLTLEKSSIAHFDKLERKEAYKKSFERIVDLIPLMRSLQDDGLLHSKDKINILIDLFKEKSLILIEYQDIFLDYLYYINLFVRKQLDNEIYITGNDIIKSFHKRYFNSSKKDAPSEGLFEQISTVILPLSHRIDISLTTYDIKINTKVADNFLLHDRYRSNFYFILKKFSENDKNYHLQTKLEENNNKLDFIVSLNDLEKSLKYFSQMQYLKISTEKIPPEKLPIEKIFKSFQLSPNLNSIELSVSNKLINSRTDDTLEWLKRLKVQNKISELDKKQVRNIFLPKSIYKNVEEQLLSSYQGSIYFFDETTSFYYLIYEAV